jgi:hypothetical protein
LLSRPDTLPGARAMGGQELLRSASELPAGSGPSVIEGSLRLRAKAANYRKLDERAETSILESVFR